MRCGCGKLGAAGGVGTSSQLMKTAACVHAALRRRRSGALYPASKYAPGFLSLPADPQAAVKLTRGGCCRRRLCHGRAVAQRVVESLRRPLPKVELADQAQTFTAAMFGARRPGRQAESAVCLKPQLSKCSQTLHPGCCVPPAPAASRAGVHG